MNRKSILAIALIALASSGCQNKPSGPALAGGKPADEWVRALSAPDAKLRSKAAEKLGNAGAIDPTVVPALCAALQDKDADVRCQAILALGKIGSEAKVAIEPLKSMVQQDRDPRVRSCAAKALEKLQEIVIEVNIDRCGSA